MLKITIGILLSVIVGLIGVGMDSFYGMRDGLWLSASGIVSFGLFVFCDVRRKKTI